ncbi:PASTA domain-containing protein [Bifidobacterium sp. ESL0763]|uniref:PASTA domain-containing protein n=1 Tax=Bifidobacterium sp. ESL0763 TaxID=2983227 RepID=UPI0023F7DFB9|nr:PASTA domain-containing protein [Bifidobacterium sp. ESL0763]MDF7663163.1 PASTA domain-containing protein [Bifidobacterium sp. ESL0763]
MQEEETMRFCTNCGKQLDDDAQFCTGCGAKTDVAEGNAPAPQTAAMPPVPMPGNSSAGAAPTPSPMTPDSAFTATSTSAGQTMPAAPDTVPLPSSATPAPNVTSEPNEQTASAAPTESAAALPDAGPETKAMPAFADQATPRTTHSSQTVHADQSPLPSTDSLPGAPAFIPGSANGAGSATGSATANPHGLAAAFAPRNRKILTIIVAAVVAVIVVVSAAAFGTYKAGVWGQKAVPDPSSLGIHKSKKTHAYSAKDVEKSLHSQGFKTTTKPTFSGQPKGTFVNYGSVRSGQRTSVRNDITIISSRGPGVPHGTCGQPVQNINENIESMNVAVHYYKVIVNDSSIKEGTVVATSPADGQPVTDSDKGIDVGVAEHAGDDAKGVGYDVIGTDKDKAQSQYQDAGFNVTMRARFSSKKMLGKIVDSNPKPGSEADGGDLTLYYGIDASGFNDAVSAKAVFGPNSDTSGTDGEVLGAAAPVEGEYCNNTGKCITLDDSIHATPAPPYDHGVFSSEHPEQQDNRYGDLRDQLLFCPAGQQAYCSANSKEEQIQNGLYGKNLGAFELTPFDTVFSYTCGDKDVPYTGSGPAICVNGNSDTDGVDLDNPPSMTGASYTMGLLYTYFPVGADVQKVVDSGYFDKGEVAKAAQQKAVDTSRPFFIRRDPSLYDKTKVDISDLSDPNPFSPFGLADGKSTMDPVKPAPSDDTAYYLVDQPQLDWSQLTEFTLSKDGKTSSTKPTKDASPDQITAAVGKGDFSTIAGKYCTNDGDCIQLDKKGSMTYSGKPAAGLDHSPSQLQLVDSEGWSDQAHNHNPNSPYINLMGPDSEYSCPGMTGKACEDYTPMSDIVWPNDLIYVFKNADTSCFSATDASAAACNPGFGDDEVYGPQPPAPTDRPYLYAMNWKHNDTPSVNGVFYLVK